MRLDAVAVASNHLIDNQRIHKQRTRRQRLQAAHALGNAPLQPRRVVDAKVRRGARVGNRQRRRAKVPRVPRPPVARRAAALALARHESVFFYWLEEDAGRRGGLSLVLGAAETTAAVAAR